MPTTVKIRRSGTASATPSALEHGEIAINYADGKVFWKNASNVITSFTFQSYALASHTHSISDVTGLQTALDGKASSSHTHGNISNAGAIGSTADQFVVTTTSGVLTAVSAATARTTLSVQPTASPAFTGAATFANTGDVVPLTVTNTGTANSFVVNDASGDTTPFVIDASGRVGVGITPTAQLHVAASGSAELAVRSTDVSAWKSRISFGNASAKFEIGTDINGAGDNNFYFFDIAASTTRLTISSTGTATFAGQILADDLTTSNSVVYGFDGDTNTGVGRAGADILTFVTNGTERVRVDASGNVGIGTQSPNVNTNGTVLHIHNSTASRAAILHLTNNETGSTSTDGVILGKWSDGTNYFYDYDSYAIVFGTANAERMRIATDGVVTMPDVYEDTVGATNRDLFIDSAGKLGYVSSIRESKTDIATLDDVSWLSALSPVSYRYRKRNADGTYSDEADGVTDYGLIAEDVEAVRPELCFYDDVDGEPQLRGVTYSKLITPMLRYIQQLEARIAALEERLSHG